MKLTPEQQAGILVTAIIHLAVIVLLLAGGIGYEVSRENTFVLDFTQQEAREKEQERAALQRSALEKLEDLIAAAGATTSSMRNVTVNRSTLKDDRGTDAEQLYRDAERLSRDLQQGQQRATDPDEDIVLPSTRPDHTDPSRPTVTYTGPSVLSWSLDGRKASRLPIPAYRCMGAGEVTVEITVNNRGDVVHAKVDEGVSSSDGCLRAFALRAARLSRFSASTVAPSRQLGTITYAFIAQ